MTLNPVNNCLKRQRKQLPSTMNHTRLLHLKNNNWLFMKSRMNCFHSVYWYLLMFFLFLFIVVYYHYVFSWKKKKKRFYSDNILQFIYYNYHNHLVHKWTFNHLVKLVINIFDVKHQNLMAQIGAEMILSILMLLSIDSNLACIYISFSCNYIVYYSLLFFLFSCWETFTFVGFTIYYAQVSFSNQSFQLSPSLCDGFFM